MTRAVLVFISSCLAHFAFAQNEIIFGLEQVDITADTSRTFGQSFTVVDEVSISGIDLFVQPRETGSPFRLSIHAYQPFSGIRGPALAEARVDRSGLSQERGGDWVEANFLEVLLLTEPGVYVIHVENESRGREGYNNYGFARKNLLGAACVTGGRLYELSFRIRGTASPTSFQLPEIPTPEIIKIELISRQNSSDSEAVAEFTYFEHSGFVYTPRISKDLQSWRSYRSSLGNNETRSVRFFDRTSFLKVSATYPGDLQNGDYE